MRLHRLFTLSLLAARCLSAQDLHFGVKGGVPITQYFETGQMGNLHGTSEYSAATRRYTVGVSAEWHFHRRLGLELDVLYKRMGYVGIVSTFSPGLQTTSGIDTKGNSWDFPLLAKYRFGRALQPYVAGGGVVRYVGPIRGRGENTVEDLVTRTTVRTPIDTTEPSEMRKRFYPGVTAACGLEIGRRRLHLLPEFRYTRWTANIAGPGGLLRFAPNQAEVLMGVLF